VRLPKTSPVEHAQLGGSGVNPLHSRTPGPKPDVSSSPRFRGKIGPNGSTNPWASQIRAEARPSFSRRTSPRTDVSSCSAPAAQDDRALASPSSLARNCSTSGLAVRLVTGRAISTERAMQISYRSRVIRLTSLFGACWLALAACGERPEPSTVGSIQAPPAQPGPAPHGQPGAPLPSPPAAPGPPGAAPPAPPPSAPGAPPATQPGSPPVQPGAPGTPPPAPPGPPTIPPAQPDHPSDPSPPATPPTQPGPTPQSPPPTPGMPDQTVPRDTIPPPMQQDPGPFDAPEADAF
jgi:hypothetical protein